LGKIELDKDKIFKGAASDKLAFYAGKEFLQKLDPKLKAHHISKLNYEKFPQPLKDYLYEIKSFFDSDQKICHLELRPKLDPETSSG
jgi:hypothetical protein